MSKEEFNVIHCAPVKNGVNNNCSGCAHMLCIEPRTGHCSKHEQEPRQCQHYKFPSTGLLQERREAICRLTS